MLLFFTKIGIKIAAGTRTIAPAILPQYFFQSFFNFFRINLFVLPQDRPRRMLAYIITSFCFCQQFLTTFFGYFNELHAFLHSLPGVFVCDTTKCTICCVWFLFVSVLSICGVGLKKYIFFRIQTDIVIFFGRCGTDRYRLHTKNSNPHGLLFCF